MAGRMLVGLLLVSVQLALARVAVVCTASSISEPGTLYVLLGSTATSTSGTNFGTVKMYPPEFTGEGDAISFDLTGSARHP